MDAVEPPPPAPQPLSVRIRQYLKGLAFRVAVYLAVYLGLSIVTIGPCFWYWFEATYVNGPRWIARFYAPLLWLCDHIPFFGWLVNLYVRWWVL